MVGPLIRSYYAAMWGAYAVVAFANYPPSVPLPWIWPYLFLACAGAALWSLISGSVRSVAWALALPAGMGVCRSASILLGDVGLPSDRRFILAGLWLFPLFLALDRETV